MHVDGCHRVKEGRRRREDMSTPGPKLVSLPSHTGISHPSITSSLPQLYAASRWPCKKKVCRRCFGFGPHVAGYQINTHIPHLSQLVLSWRAWRGVARRGVAWRGVAWRGVEAPGLLVADLGAESCAATFRVECGRVASAQLTSPHLTSPDSIRCIAGRGHQETDLVHRGAAHQRQI